MSAAPSDKPLRVLIVCEHASARFGGEAALPLHYFRVLRERGIPVWLVTHARTRDELRALYPDEQRIHYVEDTRLDRAMWHIGKRLPARIAYLTVGYVSRIGTQLAQRRVVRELVAREGISVVHQPMPVSPREPSLMFDVGAPVVIGPMNGGMDYPPAFRRGRGSFERALVAIGRAGASLLNWLMPGKRRAAMLLVANRRTQDALPSGTVAPVVELVENGVDLDLWRPAESGTQAAAAGAEAIANSAAPAPPTSPETARRPVTHFVFLGRLVDWKAVDLLIEAFADASRQEPMSLTIVGDGSERAPLERLARQAGILLAGGDPAAGRIAFRGWRPQAECATLLREADCLVLPSLFECGGAVILEAMAMGKAVIATAWGGPLDYLDDSCGILVAPTDRSQLVAGLADALVTMAREPALRGQMGNAGRRKVEREYDWSVKTDRIVAVYRSLAGANTDTARW